MRHQANSNVSVGNLGYLSHRKQGQSKKRETNFKDHANEIVNEESKGVAAEERGMDSEQQEEEYIVDQATKGICDGFNLQSCVLLIALSMHAIFEGIALGLTRETNAMINLMLGLILHKPPAAISMGVSISKNFVAKNEMKKGVMLLVIFALGTPVGVLIGMAL